MRFFIVSLASVRFNTRNAVKSHMTVNDSPAKSHWVLGPAGKRESPHLHTVRGPQTLRHSLLHGTKLCPNATFAAEFLHLFRMLAGH